MSPFFGALGSGGAFSEWEPKRAIQVHVRVAAIGSRMENWMKNSEAAKTFILQIHSIAKLT